MRNARHELRLDLPAVHRGVRVARSVLQRFARMQGMGREDTDALALVTSELLANAIDHGGGEAAMTEEDLEDDVRMRLEFEMGPDSWVLSVTDQGGGDPEEVKSQLESAACFDLEHDRGRGLFLLRASVDRFDVRASPDGAGLTFRVTKGYGGGA